MPKITVSRHGVTGAIPRRFPPVMIGGKRGIAGGWSIGATRRNTAFLRSIDERHLTGAGVAVTLTIRDCPPTSEEWHRLLATWIKRMRRVGMVRLHWVTEWQRRGVPHLHCAIWFPGTQYNLYDPVVAWWEIAAQYGTGLSGQHAKPIDGPVGWFQYLSKHAARGVKHYQRNSENAPLAWQLRTGRVWGYCGSWPLQEAVEFRLEDDSGDGGFFAFRRMVRSWRVADARSSGDGQRISFARSMLKCSEPPISRIRPVNEWITRDQVAMFLGNLAERGYSVTPYREPEEESTDEPA